MLHKSWERRAKSLCGAMVNTLQLEDNKALSLRYLSRLAPHKEVAEELAGWAAWVPGNKSKLTGGWAPGGIEDALQGMGHQEHL